MSAPRDPLEAELDDVLDPRFDAWLAGTLDEAGRAELEAEAETNPVVAAALEAFEPLSESVHEQIVADAMTSLDRERRRRRVPAVVGSVLALAAALLLFVRFVAHPAQPTYAVGFAKTRLAAEPGVESFALGETFQLLVVPEFEPPTTPVVTVFVDGWTQEARRQTAPLVDAREGMVVGGTIGEPPWALGLGRHVIHVAIGPSEVTADGTPPPSPWVVVDRVVDIRE